MLEHMFVHGHELECNNICWLALGGITLACTTTARSALKELVNQGEASNREARLGLLSLAFRDCFETSSRACARDVLKVHLNSSLALERKGGERESKREARERRRSVESTLGVGNALHTSGQKQFGSTTGTPVYACCNATCPRSLPAALQECAVSLFVAHPRPLPSSCNYLPAGTDCGGCAEPRHASALSSPFDHPRSQDDACHLVGFSFEQTCEQNGSLAGLGCSCIYLLNLLSTCHLRCFIALLSWLHRHHTVVLEEATTTSKQGLWAFALCVHDMRCQPIIESTHSVIYSSLLCILLWPHVCCDTSALKACKEITAAAVGNGEASRGECLLDIDWFARMSTSEIGVLACTHACVLCCSWLCWPCCCCCCDCCLLHVRMSLLTRMLLCGPSALDFTSMEHCRAREQNCAATGRSTLLRLQLPGRPEAMKETQLHSAQ